MQSSTSFAVLLSLGLALPAASQVHGDGLAHALRAADPALAAATAVDARAHRFGAREVLRARVQVDELPVIGGDRVALIESGALKVLRAPPLAKLAAFSLDAAHAVERGCAAVKGCVFVDATTEDVAGFGRAAWFSTPDGLLPAYRVRIPTWQIADARDLVISAVDGAVLGSRPVAVFGAVPAPTAAHSFTNFSPSAPDADLEAELQLVALEDLRPAPVGGPLRGFHFETNNCCKQYTCNDGGATCIDGNVCADGTDCAAYQNCVANRCTLIEGTKLETIATCAEAGDANAVDSFINLALPSDFIPIQIPGIGDTLYARVAFCTELPRVRSAAAAGPTGQDGWFPDPVDATREEDPLLGLEAEEDAMAEVAVYHATQQYFAHVRAVLEDPTFCLEQQSMECDANGDAVLDGDGAPVLPFHISTNVLIPEVDLNALAAQIAPAPLGQGRGGDPGNPVIVDDYQRIPNAAFIPALEGGPIQVPPELAPLLQLFSRPFDSNVYFQGARDFAYDGDVVRHEFTHGIVHTLNPELLSLGKDAYGGHAQHGSLNEGWADYFSSSFLDDPEVGEYAGAGLTAGETALRNNDNLKNCPTDIEGEVHVDSEPWAGALWTIREIAGAANVDALDRALLSAVALGDPDEDFPKASARAVDAIRAALGDQIADQAAAELEARGMTACERVFPLAVLDGDEMVVTRKNTLFQPGVEDLGLTNFAPGPMQLSVEVPAGSAGFTLTFSQGGGAIDAAIGGEQEVEAMHVLVHELAEGESGALGWTYEGANSGLAVPHAPDGTAITFLPDPANAVTFGAINEATGTAPGSFTQTLESDACNPRRFLAQFVAPAGSAVQTDVSVANVDSDAACDTGGGGGGDDDAPACGCHGVGDATPFAALLIGLVGLRLRRKRR